MSYLQFLLLLQPLGKWIIYLAYELILNKKTKIKNILVIFFLIEIYIVNSFGKVRFIPLKVRCTYMCSQWFLNKWKYVAMLLWMLDDW
jgi:hypothetical protein